MPRQIFVFTAGNPEARQHLQDSIIGPISLDLARASTPVELHACLQAVYDYAGGLYAWGAVPGPRNVANWQHIQPLDWVLTVYEATYHFVAQAIGTLHSKELAQAIWGTDPNGQTWEYMYFLTRPREVSIKLATQSEILNAGYMGFAQVSLDLARIERDFGSVDGYIERAFGQRAVVATPPVIPTQPAQPVLQLTLADIRDQLTREDILGGILALQQGAEHPFQDVTPSRLRFEGASYPPRAVVAFAAEPHLGRLPRPSDFEGDEASRILERLGFEVVPAQGTATAPRPTYFLIRMNPGSPWTDEEGRSYHFGQNVPNYKKLLRGGAVVVDSRTPLGVKLIAHGELGPAESFLSEDGSTQYRAPFVGFTPLLPPRDIDASVLDRIRALPGYNVQHAIRPISEEIYRVLVGGPMVSETAPPYTMNDALAELFIESEQLEELLALFRTRKNLILQGPPGVGKSFAAKRLAWLLLGEKSEQLVVNTQFHQSTSYEDFIRGFRPDGKGGFSLQDGLFLDLCEAAREDPNRSYVLIIDEINRGNLSKIFGELMLLIETDKRSAQWGLRLNYRREGEAPFWVPPNLYILGLMNTADRSLALVDYALRRRFCFYTLRPAFGTTQFATAMRASGVGEELLVEIQTKLGALNAKIEGDLDLGSGFLIGHSYFSTPSNGEVRDRAWYDRIVRYEIDPLLHEYWFDKAKEEVDEEVARLRR